MLGLRNESEGNGVMSNKWIVTPCTIGVRTRFLVHRDGKDEARGIWDTRKEATMLAHRLNAQEWDEEAFEGEKWIDDEIDERELLHI